MRRWMISLLCGVLAACCCFGLCSCAIKVAAEELSAGYERKATDPGKVTDAGTAALLGCSFDLFRQVVERNGENILLSPVSVAAVLAMIANGAEGETLSQVEAFLGADRDTLNRYYYAFLHGLYSSEKCKVTFADSVWLRKGLEVYPSFLQANADWFDAEVYASAFDGKTVEDINHWVKKNTDGMIPRIINEIQDNTMMYLINTLLFDAKWETLYEKGDISDGTFTCYDGTIANVTYLNSIEVRYLAGNGFSGVVKNYDGGKYSFVGLLPDEETDVYDLIDRLDGETWQAAWTSRQSETVYTKIPEFRFDCHIKLKEMLESLGITDLFDPCVANLSGMSSRELYCSTIEQKVAIDVSRNGTKAAAVTWAGFDGMGASAEPSQPKYVYLTRPFVFLIVDNMTGVPLFVGAVTDLG